MSDKKYDCNSVHLNDVLLAQVIAGEAPATQPVGELMLEDGSFQTIFVHFDKETGKPRRSAKGKLRLNARKQTPRAAEGMVVSAETLAAIATLSPAQIAALTAGVK